ncbi:hypothetical protein [Lysinibacillus sp. 3P01SB]
MKKKLLFVTAAILFIWGGTLAVTSTTEQAHDALQPGPMLTKSVGKIFVD